MADTLDLDAIEARERAATKRPWVTEPGPDCFPEGPARELHGPVSYDNDQSLSCLKPEDAIFIAHARTDIPAMATVIRAQRERIERLERAVLKSRIAATVMQDAAYSLGGDAKSWAMEVLEPVLNALNEVSK